jgi:ABC-type dipeptide/oligopeptide/nickel transport system permease component
MARYVARRLLHGLVSLWLVVTFAFLLTRVLGDPARQLLPLEHTAEEYQALRRTLGYDRSWAVQYVVYMGGLARGDLGTSTAYDRPALEVVLSRLPVTAGLAGAALLVAALVGVPLGVLAGYRPYGPMDRLSLVVATIGQAVPAFVVAILLILLFAVNLRWLPAGGLSRWDGAVLPVAALALWTMSGLIRLARSGIREVMARPFIVLARAKGLREREVLAFHALRPSLLPVVTFGGLQLGVLLTGAVVIESVFAIPGTGRLVLDALAARDQDVVQAAILVGAAGFVAANLLTDLSYSVIDPRIRLAARA